ncbi:ABC transporter ATP-binding protein [Longibacter salinarum]|uniref:ABC transporter ATP-binding protein n=1 Tax=Longibacter salinarum TaxID=1850348 RepID=A0A2A8CZF8_9BACT|nr:ABC transporter ATP-binding protein [Longibacter salinarum]PEN14014.1 ABC transporter ATP-binding protein [Longibacter salinarum]
MQPAVSVSSLEKTYRSGVFRSRAVRALDGVSMTIPPGSIFGLLGPNGAGKTTMVKILLGVAYATGGEARLFGHEPGDPVARERVGYLPEKHDFPDFLTAPQMLNIYGQMAGVPDEIRAQRIPELLERVGLDHASEQKLSGFSKGMLQRAGLAQALLNEPDLLILDEPTDGVDPVGRREIRDILLELKEEGKTVLINSHLLSEVEKVCTEVAILNDGQLVRTGNIDELTAVDRTYTLVCTAIPNGTRAALGNIVHVSSVASQNGSGADEASLQRYSVHPEDRAGLNHVIDRLRNAGVEIDSISPVRQTLEDYFVDVVKPQQTVTG